MKPKKALKDVFGNKLLVIMILCALVSMVLSTLFLAGVLRFQERSLTDFLYSEKKTMEDLVIVAIDDTSLQEIGRWPWDRAVHARIIDHLNESRVIGIDIAFFERSDEENDIALATAINNSEKVVLVTEYSQDLFFEPAINSNAATGHANLFIDKDGTLRAFPADMPKSKGFAVVVAEKYINAELHIDGRHLINFFGKVGAYQHFSAAEVYHGRVGREEFKDKIVLIGATYPDSHDDHSVPISKERRMPGVEIHANIVQTILTGSFIDYEPNIFVVLSLFLMAALAGLMLFNFRIGLGTLFCILLIIAYLVLAIKMFDRGVIMNIIYPLLCVALSYISILAFFYLSEEKQRRWITNAFGSYVSHSVVQELIDNPEKLRLGGQKKVLSVFFSDIRGFTTMSEKISPEKLVSLLNEYLTDMTEVILDNRGLVDKYIGDAIMAIWGAPLDDKNHAFNACNSAILMRKKLAELTVSFKKRFGVELRIGMGINTGEMVVGNMGSKNRFDYTVIGDNVNFASRLEGLTKQYHVGILISQQTYDLIDKKWFITRELDFVKVKGKSKPVKIYELVGYAEDITEKEKKMISVFSRGLNLYFHRKWKEGIAEFEKAKKANNDKTSGIYIDRCKEFLKNPPKGEWDGVFEAKNK